MKRIGRSKGAARIGDAAVQAKTGKTWAQWFAALDAAGCRKMGHRDIVAHLRRQGLGPWWQQMVTVTYEQARGMRHKHQKPEGYEISVSRTIAVPVSALYRAWQDQKLLGKWLPEMGLTVRKATRDKSIRLNWGDGTSRVQASFYPKGSGRSQVTAQHSRLGDARQAARMEVYWAEHLGRLKAILEA